MTQYNIRDKKIADRLVEVKHNGLKDVWFYLQCALYHLISDIGSFCFFGGGGRGVNFFPKKELQSKSGWIDLLSTKLTNITFSQGTFKSMIFLFPFGERGDRSLEGKSAKRLNTIPLWHSHFSGLKASRRPLGHSRLVQASSVDRTGRVFHFQSRFRLFSIFLMFLFGMEVFAACHMEPP